MGKLVELDLEAFGDGAKFEAASVLDAAKDAELESVVIVGREPDGEFYLAGTNGTAETLMLLIVAQSKLVEDYE